MRITRARLIAASIGLVFLVGGSVYTIQAMDRFLIRDPRFILARPDSRPEESLRIAGVSHASMRAIEAVFAEDVGRSLYLVPMEERLAALRTVPWVRDAAIARVWPDRLIVNISERIPVAFVTLPSSRFGLIDADGIILPPAKDRFTLPVLNGVKPSQDVNVRREAVHRMLRLTDELGDALKDVSEVDVTKPDNILVSREYGGRMRKLMLGDRDYRLRYQNFLDHFAEIDAKIPGARVIDLRLEDRITVVE